VIFRQVTQWYCGTSIAVIFQLLDWTPLSQRAELGRVHLYFDLPQKPRGDIEKSLAIAGANGQVLNPRVKIEDYDLTLWHE